ncbi:MAG TPA: metallophosphoesterase [Nitrososphaeraceae archaeon]|nr:metallophosphoesterase [Nitrososphaeraceae archaeon]
MNRLVSTTFVVILITTFVLIFNTAAYAHAQEPLPTSQKHLNTESGKKSFNIAVASDWGCDDNAKATAKNIQSKDPELVIAGGDASYKKSAECWFKIIQPFKSKLKIAMGDHEYSDTSGGAMGVINQYLKPLNLVKTYYSYDLNNAHFVFIDPYIDYKPGSAQYQFVENDLKTASTNTKIDWRFVVQSVPMYTSPSKHPADSNIRDIYHPLFDKYKVDIVFNSDNHNYQRTFPLKYNNGDSSNPIVTNRKQIAHYNDNNNNNEGVIYLITGTAGRSHYEFEGQAPYIVKQNSNNFGFVNIDINGKNLEVNFYPNIGAGEPKYQSVTYQNNPLDKFTISKENTANNKLDNL